MSSFIRTQECRKHTVPYFLVFLKFLLVLLKVLVRELQNFGARPDTIPKISVATECNLTWQLTFLRQHLKEKKKKAKGPYLTCLKQVISLYAAVKLETPSLKNCQNISSLTLWIVFLLCWFHLLHFVFGSSVGSRSARAQIGFENSFCMSNLTFSLPLEWVRWLKRGRAAPLLHRLLPTKQPWPQVVTSGSVLVLLIAVEVS